MTQYKPGNTIHAGSKDLVATEPQHKSKKTDEHKPSDETEPMCGTQRWKKPVQL